MTQAAHLGRARYAGRVLSVCAAHPVEGLDRIRNRIELAVWRGRTGRYAPEPDWEARLHALLGAPWPCEDHAAFSEIWAEMNASVERLGKGHDSDHAIARAAWCAARHLMPERVVETGVARGVSTRVLLEALAANGRGHLWSIDLPPMIEGWHREVAMFVPDRLRPSWTYIRGSSRRNLSRLFASLDTIDLFLHSSLITEPNARFELGRALDALRPGGVLLADCVEQGGQAFAASVEHAAPSAVFVAAAEGKPSPFGIVVR